MSADIDKKIKNAKDHARMRAKETKVKYEVWLAHYGSAGHGMGTSVYVIKDGDTPPKETDTTYKVERIYTARP